MNGRLVARWLQGKPGGKPPPDSDVLQIALRLHKTPDEIEQMDVYWFNRLKLLLLAEAESLKPL